MLAAQVNFNFRKGGLMKIYLPQIALILLFSVLTIISGNSQDVPVFLVGDTLTFSDGVNLFPTGTQYYSVPCVVDWDGDDKKDLLGGYFYNGWVYLYTNVGSNSQPAFIHGNETLMQADGSTISVAYG